MSIPTPQDIADGRAMRNKTTAAKMSSKMSFYDSPITGKPYSYLNSSWPPSVQEIGDYQISCLTARMAVDPTLQDIANALSKDITVPVGEGEANIEEAIANIEKALSFQETGSAAQMSKVTSTENVTKLMRQYEVLRANLQLVYNMIYSSGGAIPGSQLKIELERVTEMMNQIGVELASIDPGATAHTVSPKTIGYLKKAEWLGRRLKGKYLEVVGTKWMGDKLPSNIKVVNVGKITGPTMNIFGEAVGLGKMIRTDIMGFDISKNIPITFTVKNQTKTLPLIEFLNYVEQNGETETINLDADNYEALQTALIVGVQAKAGKNQAVFNPTTVSLNQAIATEGGAGYANNLNLLISLVQEAKYIAKTHEYYDAMFNYCLAKGLTNIIGKENNLVLTRNGISLMRDYLIDQWRMAKRYVQAKNRVHLDTPDAPVTVVYSSAGANK